MNNLDKIGKILFALPFGIFGIFHFMGADNMAGMIPSWLPGGVLWVYITGLALLAACISMLTGKMTRLATLLLGVMMLVFVLTIHLPGVMSGDQMAMPGVLKDLALAGAAFFVSGKSEA
jgi:uncharacterized membrane protein YphA (DoxX/SURF4 family)